MSRCIPYARTNYKREDVSLIGSIKKLQIQWRNTKQRKPVSGMVKEKIIKKRSREEYDKQDFSQLENKKRKVEKNFTWKDDIDHFERSDLSEEHCPPALVLNKCDSWKGSQNAVKDSDPNKKRPGMVIRVKLALKKHKDVEPESASTDLHCSSQVTKSFKHQAILSDSSPRFSEIAKTSEAQVILNKSASGCCSELTKPSDGKSVVLTESSLRTKEVCSANQPETSAEPCFDGHVAMAPVFQECFVWANPDESRQHERSGTQRSERQLFRNLIINWKPPPIQLIEADEGELDWVLAPKKSEDAKLSAQICKTGVSDPSTCPSYASSLQPRATYLPEFDMYQLPYVIPF